VRDDQPIPEPSGALLSGHLLHVYAAERPLGQKTLAGYSEAVRRYAHWLGRPATLGDLDPRLANRWLMSLDQEGVTKITQHGLRRRVLAIWRHAFEAELIDVPPLRVRKIRPERRLPRAWTPEDVLALIAVARKKKGNFLYVPVPRGAFWVAFIRTAFETGLRLGDLLGLQRSQFSGDGELTVVQAKTGNEIVCRVWPETLAAIDATSPNSRPFIFGGVISRDFYFQEFRRLVKKAGLKGTSKWLRRAGATAVERAQPGMAAKFLGHRSPAMAAQHYLDPRLLQVGKPMPPRLEGGEAC
jgi:integrase